MRELSMSQQLTLFTEASLVDVNHSVLQDSKKGKTTTDTSGLSFRDWSESLNRIGSWLKTYLEFCVSLRTKCVLTSKVKATKSGFTILKLRLSVLHTGEKEFFLWRTPTAHDYRGANSKENFKKRQERKMPLSLNDQVAHLLPTPLAHDAHPVSPSDYKRHSPPLGCYAGGSLNPEWVEWLMGYPTGWTELER